MYSTVAQKLIASGVNCSIVFALSLPLRPFMPAIGWKLFTMIVFWSYCVTFAGNDIGMMVAGTHCEPTGLLAATCYTASFTTLLWRIKFPFDLMIANGCLQIPCLIEKHNTLHGLIAGYHTISS